MFAKKPDRGSLRFFRYPEGLFQSNTIEIMTIAEDHQIIIRKSDEYARNGLRWCKIKDGVRDSRIITGKDFGTGIYQRFGLNRGYRYKARFHSPARK